MNEIDPLGENALDRLADRIASRIADLIADKVADRLRAHQDRLLTLRELAHRLGIAPRTAQEMVKRHELPPALLHTSGSTRWDYQAVLRYLDRRSGRPIRKGRGKYDRTKPKDDDQ